MYNITEYEQQAAEFLKKYNLTMYLHRLYTKENADVYKVEFVQNECTTEQKIVTIEFTDSRNNTSLRLGKEAGRFGIEELYRKKLKPHTVSNFETFREEAKNYQPPSTYSVLACLYNYSMDFVEFCDSFGYDQDKISALNIYTKCLAETKELSKVFNAEAWRDLQEIN